MASKRTPRAAALLRSKGARTKTTNEPASSTDITDAKAAADTAGDPMTMLPPPTGPSPIDLAVFDFKLDPGDARETNDGNIACVAAVEARILEWFLPIWDIASRHLRKIDRRLFSPIMMDATVPSCTAHRFIVRWQPASTPTDLQIAAVKAKVLDALRELTATLDACRHATPTSPLGAENSLARKVQQYIAANPINFEPEFQLKPEGEAPMERVRLATREALPWVSVDQDADRPIMMKPIRMHNSAGRVSAVLADGTPFEGTFGDADHLSLQLGALVGHWITVTGQLELDQKPLSTSQRLSGSISRILAVSTAWHKARLPAIHAALETISSLPTIEPPAFDPNAGTLFAGSADDTPVQSNTSVKPGR